MLDYNELVGCPACKGQKTIMGAGMIYKDCENCLGVGWVEPKKDLQSVQSVTTTAILDPLDAAFDELVQEEVKNDERNSSAKRDSAKKTKKTQEKR